MVLAGSAYHLSCASVALVSPRPEPLAGPRGGGPTAAWHLQAPPSRRLAALARLRALGLPGSACTRNPLHRPHHAADLRWPCQGHRHLLNNPTNKNSEFNKSLQCFKINILKCFCFKVIYIKKLLVCIKMFPDMHKRNFSAKTYNSLF